MKFKSFKLLALFPLLLFLLSGCETMQVGKKSKKVFKHDTPLIKQDVKILGKKELEKSAAMGPIPIEGDIKKLENRKQISSVK
jgi:type IV pilus assembly protein PilQ